MVIVPLDQMPGSSSKAGIKILILAWKEAGI